MMAFTGQSSARVCDRNGRCGSRPKVALSQQPDFPGRPSGGGNFWAVPSCDQKGLAYSIAFGVGRERLIAISRAVARP
jgi:hypothetical protein